MKRKKMTLVVIESPYKGMDWSQTERNLAYLQFCMRDCFRRGEAPYASHGLYTQKHVLDDKKPEERKLGMKAGFDWGELAEKRAMYVDLGVFPGMRKGKGEAKRLRQKFELRILPDDLMEEFLKAIDNKGG